MEDLRPKIDQAILDIRDRNYGLAESRLFKFLDDLDELQRKMKTHEEWWNRHSEMAQMSPDRFKGYD